MPEPQLRSEWVHVKNELMESVYAEQVFCSIVTEMKLMPQFQNQPALAGIHRENYETSYHRNTAVGNLSRLQAGEANVTLVLMTVECLAEAARHDNSAESSLGQMHAATPDDQVWLRAAANWHARRSWWVRRAAASLQASVGPELWEQGLSLAQ